ncbi:meiotic recombination protein SPO11-1 isoform X3 [Capsicum annuum]|uniref:meiotic recombination protein SPO11-1 isoform X3 n=1 Tax=Capsicum annuum TaxID=4072 RepID=UPI001FB0D28B|nr:meiotic recombination protein SPO11-1 isoform X3 [Capsicum annuum]
MHEGQESKNTCKMMTGEVERKMERKRLNAQPLALIRKIKGFTRSIVEGLARGSAPLIYIDRFRNYCTDTSGNCSCSSGLPAGKEAISLKRECHARRLDVLLRVLLIVQQLLQEKRHGSKRDIYYMHPTVFKEQSVVDRAINDICILLQCSRHNLNVVSVGNGLVMGWLRYVESGRKIDCISNPNTAYPIPVHVEEVNDILSVAQYVLVVEKESVFQRLANDQFCKRNHCIVITGRGYPDVPTRRFLRLLIDKLHLPVYCLVDCDPYGFDILTTYKFGSLDSDNYSIPQQCLLPLTVEDKRKVEAMLHRCYLQREVPKWRFELELLLYKGVKFEIEALSVHSLTFLSHEYLPSKINNGGCLQLLGWWITSRQYHIRVEAEH